MDINIVFILTGLMLFAHWFNYVVGSPLAEHQHMDGRAILFGLSVWLADRRLRQTGRYRALKESLLAQLDVTPDPLVREDLYVDNQVTRVERARSVFTWERALLCPVCLHWWLSLVFVVACLLLDRLHVREHVWLAAFTYLVNHFFIRKI